jgi:hypothetical protein
MFTAEATIKGRASGVSVPALLQARALIDTVRWIFLWSVNNPGYVFDWENMREKTFRALPSAIL